VHGRRRVGENQHTRNERREKEDRVKRGCFDASTTFHPRHPKLLEKKKDPSTGQPRKEMTRGRKEGKAPANGRPAHLVVMVTLTQTVEFKSKNSTKEQSIREFEPMRVSGRGRKGNSYTGLLSRCGGRWVDRTRGINSKRKAAGWKEVVNGDGCGEKRRRTAVAIRERGFGVFGGIRGVADTKGPGGGPARPKGGGRDRVLRHQKAVATLEAWRAANQIVGASRDQVNDVGRRTREGGIEGE